MKTICFFGIYNSKYSRNRILIDGIKELGHQVIECQIDPKFNNRFFKYIILSRKWLRIEKNNYLHDGDKNLPDYVFVAFPGQTCVALAWFLVNFSYLKQLISLKQNISKPVIIFDCFTSLYDSNTFDRRKNKKICFSSIKDWILDFTAIKIADICLADTQEHLKYFLYTFFARKDKFICVRVGTDAKIFNLDAINNKPNESIYKTPTNNQEEKNFIIHFHGNYIPLHGVEYIIDAAKYVSDDRTIKFILIGNGQTYNLAKDKIKTLNLGNVIQLDKIPYEDLPNAIANSDLCLGCFGDTEKTKRVIPNKIYEYAAMGKAIITANTCAIKEVFTDMKDIYLCNPSDGKSLGEAILILKHNASLRSNIGKNANLIYSQNFTPKTIAQRMFHSIENRKKNVILDLNESN